MLKTHSWEDVKEMPGFKTIVKLLEKEQSQYLSGMYQPVSVPPESGLDDIKSLPSFKTIVKTLILDLIQELTVKMSSLVDEESVMITANISDGNCTNLSSTLGHGFVEESADIQAQFLGYCRKKSNSKLDQKAHNQHITTQSSAVTTGHTTLHGSSKGQATLVSANPRSLFHGSVNNSNKSKTLKNNDLKSDENKSEHKSINSIGSTNKRSLLNRTKDDGGTMTLNSPTTSGAKNVQTVVVMAADHDSKDDLNLDTMKIKIEIPSDLDMEVTPGDTTFDDYNADTDEASDEDDHDNFNDDDNDDGSDIDNNFKEEKMDLAEDLEIKQEETDVPTPATSSMVNKKKSIDSMPYQCSICGNRYSSRGNLKRHIETHEERQVCECGSTFSTREQLSRHKLAIHLGGFNCKKCNQSFKSRSALMFHNRKHHDKTTGRILKCTVCGKTFGQMSHLKEHTRYVHSEEAEFQCRICNKKMKFARSFKRHDCTKGRSGRSATLITHHVCGVCNKTFTARRYLDQHSQCHTGVNRPCPKCGRTFKFESSFSRHITRCTT